MSHMKSAMIEDDGFVTLYYAQRPALKAAQTALAEFGTYLGWSDTEVSASEAKKLIRSALDFLDAQPHPIHCPRCYDDRECRCSIGRLTDDLTAAMDDLR